MGFIFFPAFLVIFYPALTCYYLVECGTDCAAGLSDDDFRELIRKQYLEVLDDVY